MKKSSARRTQKIKGTHYVFEDYPRWDSEKKQIRHDRVYIGKLDADGEFVPNKTYVTQCQLQESQKELECAQERPSTRTYCGATHLLDVIAQKTGIKDDLKASFPNDYLKVLSLANYLVLENDNPMYRFSKWANNHCHPFGEDLPSQRISELFASISENAKMKFFENQSGRRIEKEHLMYDTTSISSYSELISHVKYGKNKDDEPLPQINLALVFGQESMMPVYYRKLPGNITDVQTVRKLLKDIECIKTKKVKFVMDRGFFSSRNLNSMYQNHYKFLIGGKRNTKFVGTLIEQVRESIKDFSNYDIEQDVYRVSSMGKWPYEEYGTDGKVVHSSDRRIYIHIYYNGQRAEEEKSSFIKTLADSQAAVLEGSFTEAQQTMCGKYFYLKTTPARGTRLQHNEQAIQEHIKHFGYFALLSNEIKDPSEALYVYRNKDLIEKSFGNLKNRLNMRRPLVSSSENLEGKLFVQFVALMLVSYIHKSMKEGHLYKNYSMQKLLDDLDIIEKFDYPGKRPHYSEITKKQKDLYACFGVEAPSML